MLFSDEEKHNEGGKEGDGNRGNGMGKENLQKLNVTGNHGNQVTLFLSFQFGRTEFPKCGKNPVPDQGKDAEGNIMVTVLLSIVQDSSGNGKKKKQTEKRRPADFKGAESVSGKRKTFQAFLSE